MDADLVYTTQHGGELKRIDDRLIFTKQPNYMGVKVGDALPEGWILSPKDDATRKALEQAIPDNKPLQEDDIVFT